MDFLHLFFSLNQPLVYFVYGLVFFIVGLAIALQSRNYSRLDLARSLKWLSAFGFTHGLNEWADLFIPIQADYLSPASVRVLHDLHLLLLAVSYACLFEFGVTLLSPLGRGRWLHGISGALLAIWFFVAYFPLPALFTDLNTWLNVANALARYFIGFTGALLAAYGLRQHTLQRIVPLHVPDIVKMLQFAGIMLALYSILGGLIVPPIPFFPGNLLNSSTFEGWIGIPPQVFRSMIGLGLAFAIIRALEVFNVETDRIIEAMEQRQILDAERNRIGRELHDGAIQKVYTAGLLIESAQKLAEAKDQVMATRLEKAEIVLNDAINDLRRNLGELNAISVQKPLREALDQLAHEPGYQSLVDIALDISLPDNESLSPIRSEHIMAIVNEALSNIIRHAHAHHVKISAWLSDERLKITIEDDGEGVPEVIKAGYGLRNMRDRARLVDGQIEIKSTSGKGTMISLDVPWIPVS